MSSDADFDVAKYAVPRSDQINADDLVAGPMTVTVARVRDKGGVEQPVEVFLEEVDRVWRPCKTTLRTLIYGWGTRTGQWKGRQVRLYRDPTVTWAGEAVGGIRISHMSDLDGDLARGFVLSLAKSKKAKGAVEVRPLKRQGAQQAREPEPAPEETTRAAPPELLAKAELAAQQGTVTLEGWWKNSSKEDRLALQRHLGDLKAKAKQADERGAPTEADPFSAGAGDGERQPGED